MAYPTSTFQRSDSQSGFYTQTQQQRSSTNTGQQGQQSQSSRPRFESRSSSRSTTAQQQLSEFCGDDGVDENWEEDRFHVASETVRQIGQKIRSISGGDDVDIEGFIELFRQIKKAQKDGDLSYLQSCKPTVLESLSDPLGQLLKKLANNFQSDDSLVSCLNADDIHALFNGLSTIVGESVNESLFTKAHFSKVRDSLGNITEALLEHAIKKNFLQNNWDNSSLINVLNWLSRGLKLRILSAESSNIKNLFTQSILLMKDWAPETGEASRATTAIAPLDTRQLGKCMVQINTALKFNLLEDNAPDNLVHDVVIGLCGGKALNQCTMWLDRSECGKTIRQLTPAAPGGVEITNISNTIKDCLHNDILQLEDSRVQLLIQQLCHHMNAISETQLIERSGQRLGNCCNFLREIFEVEHAATKKPVAIDRTEYGKACKRMLEQIAKMSPFVSLSAQSIANLLSFVKAMDRTRSQPSEMLSTAASKLMSQLRGVSGDMKMADSIAATLGGVQYLASRGLIPQGSAVDQMFCLINEITLEDLTQWPPKSRAVLMQAVVYCWNDRSVETPHSLLALMERLLFLPDKVNERYPYLMAVSLLIKRDPGWLARHQSLLSRLLPGKAGALISEDDVLREVTYLKAGEPAIELISVSDPNTCLGTGQKSPGTPPATTPAQTITGKTTPSRMPVGMTRLIEPVKVGTTPITTVVKKPAGKLDRATESSSLSSHHTAQVKQDDVDTLVSTEPVFVTRRKSATETKSGPENEASDENESKVKKDVRLNNPPVAEKKTTVEKKSANGEKSKPIPPKNRTELVTKAPPAKKTSKLTAEQEWFQLLKQEKPLSLSQLQRLSALLRATPRLAISSEGKGSKARPALFYALSTGNTEAMRLIMLANPQVKRDLALTLKQFLDGPFIMTDLTARGLSYFLSLLSVTELDRLREALRKKYQPGEMQKKVPEALLDVLRNKGFCPGEKSMIGLGQDMSPVHEKNSDAATDELKNNDYSATKQEKISKENIYDSLFLAAVNGDARSIESLISQELGHDLPNYFGDSGLNILMVAAQAGHADVVKLLLKQASAADQAKAVAENGFNALMLAAQNGHAAAVKSLIDHASGAEQAKMVSKHGFNALMLAAADGHAAAVKSLIDHASGAEQAKMVSKDGWNALMLAAANGNAAVVKSLIDLASGAEQVKVHKYGLNALDGLNALIIAAQNGNPDIVKSLIDHASGAEQAKMVNRDGFNALMMAAQIGHAAAVKSLIDHASGAEQVKVNVDGFNALMIAARHGHAATVKSLIDHASGAEQAKMVSKNGFNALMLAAQNGHAAAVKSLVDHASGAEQAKMVNKDGFNALMIAAQNGHAAAVKSLIDHASGAEQAKMVGKNNFNALMIAAQFGHTGVVKSLMDHPSEVDQRKAVNSAGKTALMIAIKRGHHDTARVLNNMSPSGAGPDLLPTEGQQSMPQRVAGALWSIASNSLSGLFSLVKPSPPDDGKEKFS